MGLIMKTDAKIISSNYKVVFLLAACGEQGNRATNEPWNKIRSRC